MSSDRAPAGLRRLRLWPWLLVVATVILVFLFGGKLLDDRREDAETAGAAAVQLEIELTTLIQTAAASAPRNATGTPPAALVPVLRRTVRRARSRIREIRRLGGEDARLAALDQILAGAQAPLAAGKGITMPASAAMRVATLVRRMMHGVAAQQQQRVERITNQTRVGVGVLALVVLLLVSAIIWHARRVLGAAADAHADVLRHLAYNDGLTGLPNRRSFEDDAARAPARTQVVLCDLDGFKAINDRDGHAAGDAVLVQVAGALAGAVGDEGRIYRLGGDEFCGIVAPGAPDLAARLEHAVARATGDRVAVSVGVAQVPADGTTVRRALRRADERMYAGKALRSTQQGETAAA